jgi:ketosteroid isomerase-like protein
MLWRLPPGAETRRRALKRAMTISWAGSTRSDFDFQLLLIEPDVAIRIHGARGIGLRESYRGHDGVVTMTQDWKEDFPDLAFEVTKVIDRGNLLAARVVGTGRGRSSGIETQNVTGIVYRISARGRVEEIHLYWDWEDALVALDA